MCLKKQEREFFRKLLENFFVKNTHFKKCQVVDHFDQEGILRQTVYNALNRRKKWSINSMWHTLRPSFILDIFYEGKIEETAKQPKRCEPFQVKLKILPESNILYFRPSKSVAVNTEIYINEYLHPRLNHTQTSQWL
jgi:hypothetical protein